MHLTSILPPWQSDLMSKQADALQIDTDSSEIQKIMRETLKPSHITDPFVLKFIGNYVHTISIQQASRLSGLSGPDGRNLFNRPDIYKCITRITDEAVVKFGYDAAEVVERVKELAFVDIADLFDGDGRIIENIHDIPAEVRRAVKKFKYKSYFEDDINGVPQYRGRIYEVELWDKPRSLELLGREKDTFKKTVVQQHDVSRNAAEFLLGSLRRAEERVAALAEPQTAIDVTPVVPVVEIQYDAAGPKPTGFSKPPGVL